MCAYRSHVFASTCRFLRNVGLVVLLVIGAVVLAACSCGPKRGALKPVVAVTPADGTRDVRPSDPVSVQVDNGKLTSIDVTTSDGARVPGTLKDGRFTPERGGFSVKATYHVTVKIVDGNGHESTRSTYFNTLTPHRVNKIEVLPGNNITVGIGQPISLAFDSPVKDKAAVERRLKVITSNNTEGSWGWVTEPITGRERADWRPKEYWIPGTKVTLDADLNGIDTGNSRYLVRSYFATFTIGPSHIAKIDLNAHTLTLVRDGKKVKTIPVSGGDVSHRTWSGKMTLMSKEGTIRMNSQTVGLGNDYDLKVHRSMRMTVSGTYAHQAEWAEAAIGIANTSHGCLGMTTKDAAWFYEQAQVGDVFEVNNGKGTVAPGNGFGEWNLPWKDWQRKSALR
ncbi:Ig-like domain-containing protein [Streptomyces noursei]|uniref:L,D-transpeptidase n=1 Tax=Streptomyces noursei TaxID=1971 RepID=UPI0033DE4FC8